MLKIECIDHLLETISFAATVNATDVLLDKIKYLSEYSGGRCLCAIHKDWAPHSFDFVMFHEDGSRWFNGGLIYSGPGQPLDGSAPALTVGIGIDSTKHTWSVHT